MRADAQAKREIIAQAAKELILREGIDISFRQIAAEASVGVATVHRHFPTKFELLKAVMPKILGDASAILMKNEVRWESDPRAAWREAVIQLAEMAAVLLKDSIIVALAEDPEAVAIRTILLDDLQDLLASLLKKATMHGYVSEELTPLQFHLGLGSVSRPLPEKVTEMVPGYSSWAVENFMAGLEATAKKNLGE
ncbi:TetR/AcrR family transcriptional regulator [Corynebacterium crudilactis]|uniref:HTH tetR-type domain-containing protein n=1 Tax=Corynebacterium crudilactis TaxID=1652495 RepID=A0A172QW91_9CORY|nr:TetR/AcrR family transcriptional regulator [Corynebacterium crudilactis]ANE04890.1 hypothetical protein ccrud_12235 [Corynebacterium crudilactis]